MPNDDRCHSHPRSHEIEGERNGRIMRPDIRQLSPYTYGNR
jgi:hypothetical protein